MFIWFNHGLILSNSWNNAESTCYVKICRQMTSVALCFDSHSWRWESFCKVMESQELCSSANSGSVCFQGEKGKPDAWLSHASALGTSVPETHRWADGPAEMALSERLLCCRLEQGFKHICSRVVHVKNIPESNSVLKSHCTDTGPQQSFLQHCVLIVLLGRVY